MSEKKKKADAIKSQTEKNAEIKVKTEQEKRIEEAQKVKESKQIQDQEYNTLNKVRREVKRAKKTGNVIDEAPFKDVQFTDPAVQSKAEELYNDVLEHNKKLRENNKVTLENVAQRKYKTKDLNSLNNEQQKDVLLTYNNYKQDGVKTFDQLNTEPITLPQEVKNAANEGPRSAETLSQRPGTNQEVEGNGDDREPPIQRQ